MEAPFDRNFPALTQQEQRQLWESHVCVVGCGGLGGYIIEYLARVGVGVSPLWMGIALNPPT